MKIPAMKNTRKDEHGSALIIVLAFLFLLTIVTIAFLSRSLLERQLSNASLNQNKIDLVAQGAAASIIGDLQQEIVAGSTESGGIYTPVNSNTPIPSAIIPASVGFTHAVPPAVDGLEDLLKVSQTGQSFFPTDANHPNDTPSNRASQIDTTQTSLNFRSVSLARWNKALLLAKKDPTLADTTPVDAFPIPDWIYVARDGSNPTAWDSQYESVPSISPVTPAGAGAGKNPITQRYAYAIYDEGSTLDMNVAGSPITSASGTSVTYTTLQPYKNALAYADLTQLPYLSTTELPVAGGMSTALSVSGEETFINALVGWRNYASSEATLGNFPGVSPAYAFGPATGSSPLTPFDLSTFSNTSGYLSAQGNAAGTQSDNAFTSRQQLLQFLLKGLGQNQSFLSTSGLTPTILQNILPYLGTFSRDINQPSYAPAPLTGATPRPKVLDKSNGGNNAAGFNLDDAVNPNFLDTSVQVKDVFPRADNSPAVVGEPLVKKRFALSRLAWLTYEGPSADVYANNPNDANVKALMAQGVSAAYLQEGNKTNIQNYFGLDWDSTKNRWVYDYHNNGGAPASGSVGSIMKLSTIAALGATAHDPDFFELLKASISLGSLGKSLTVNNTVLNDNNQSDASYPPNYYYPLDTSVDAQIIQIGANIIDQYQTAGYPVRIAFNDGNLGNILREYVSVENYPYFYGVITGVIPTQNSSANPAASGDGMGVITQWPIVWNPHDPNSSIGAAGTYPTIFRITADATDPDTLLNNGAVTAKLMCYTNAPAGNSNDPTKSTLQSPFNTYGPGDDPVGSNSNYHLASITNGSSNSAGACSNSAIDLTITGAQGHQLMFHDPTIIMTKGGLSLNAASFQYGSNHLSASLEAVPSDQVISSVCTTAGIMCNVSNPTSSSSSEIMYNQGVGQRYLGFYLGAFPLAWMGSTGTPIMGTSASIATVSGQTGGNTQNIYVTYRMQYKDSSGSWITYDTKYACPTSDPLGNHSFNWGGGGTGMATSSGSDMSMNSYLSCAIDPRSHRFGVFTHFEQDYPFSSTAWPYHFLEQESGNDFTYNGNNYGGAQYKLFESAWLDTGANIIPPFRQDTAPGAFFCGPSIPTTKTTGWNLASNCFRTGLLSQNSTQMIDIGIRYDVDGQGGGAGGSSDYYADPDGVVRRADGGYVPPGDRNSPSANAVPGSADTTMGLPMVQSGGWGSGVSKPSTGLVTQINKLSNPQTAGETGGSACALNAPSGGIPLQTVSRPYFLHRPFRSVAEMGYAFRDTPWKSINFSMPESGDSALLDVFTLNENHTPTNLEAGKVNLNTRQPYVLAALLSNGSLDDPETSAGGTFASPQTAVLGGPAALLLAQGIVARTTDTTDIATGSGPFQNLSELVGKWNNQTFAQNRIVHPSGVNPAASLSSANSSFIDGMLAYVGFSGMPTPPALTSVTSTIWTSSTSNSSTLNTSKNPNLMSLYTTPGSTGPNPLGVFPTTTPPLHAGLPEAMAYAKRYHEAPIRALVNTTQTRVWNLLIDVIAQAGRFPSVATSLSNFNVEGERRYWVHVAIDRYSGKVLDEQLEEVKE
jgi:hypothetical protein